MCERAQPPDWEVRKTSFNWLCISRCLTFWCGVSESLKTFVWFLNSTISYHVFTISSIPAYRSRCLPLYSTPTSITFLLKVECFLHSFFLPEPSAMKILQYFLYGNNPIRQNTELWINYSEVVQFLKICQKQNYSKEAVAMALETLPLGKASNN